MTDDPEPEGGGPTPSDENGAASDARDDEPEASADAPVRVCRKCSTQSLTAGEYCPHCGASFVRRRRRLGRRGIVIAVAVLLLLAGGATAGIIAKTNHDNAVKAEQARKLAAEQAAADAARKRAEAKRKTDQAVHDLQVSFRKDLIRALQKSVTKDAEKDVSDGVLDGPILRTECTPVGGGNVDNLAEHTGNYSCLAITKVNGDGTASGYGFSATVNYDSGSYTWHLGN
jgi:hypothetical protein